MADSECIARAELRVALESGEPGLPQQWRAAFSSVEEMLSWAGQHHPNLLARTLFAAVAELDASLRADYRGPERSVGRGRSAPARRARID